MRSSLSILDTDMYPIVECLRGITRSLPVGDVGVVSPSPAGGGVRPGVPDSSGGREGHVAQSSADAAPRGAGGGQVP